MEAAAGVLLHLAELKERCFPGIILLFGWQSPGAGWGPCMSRNPRAEAAVRVLQSSGSSVLDAAANLLSTSLDIIAFCNRSKK